MKAQIAITERSMNFADSTEPYEGFFEENGFTADRYGLYRPAATSHRTEMKVDLEGLLNAKSKALLHGFPLNQFPLPLAPVITLEKVVFYQSARGEPVVEELGSELISEQEIVYTSEVSIINLFSEKGIDFAPITEAIKKGTDPAPYINEQLEIINAQERNSGNALWARENKVPWKTTKISYNPQAQEDEIQEEKSIQPAGEQPAKGINIYGLIQNLFQKEEAGEDIMSLLKAAQEEAETSGGKFWAGYIVTLQTSISSQVVVVKEDFADARKTVEDLVGYAKKTALELYSNVNATTANSFVRKVNSLYTRLCEEEAKLIQYMARDADIEDQGGLPEGAHGDEDDETMAELLEAQREKAELGYERTARKPIIDWLSLFNLEVRRAGDQAEYFLNHIENYIRYDFENSHLGLREYQEEVLMKSLAAAVR